VDLQFCQLRWCRTRLCRAEVSCAFTCRVVGRGCCARRWASFLLLVRRMVVTNLRCVIECIIRRRAGALFVLLARRPVRTAWCASPGWRNLPTGGVDISRTCEEDLKAAEAAMKRSCVIGRGNRRWRAPARLQIRLFIRVHFLPHLCAVVAKIATKGRLPGAIPSSNLPAMKWSRTCRQDTRMHLICRQSHPRGQTRESRARSAVDKFHPENDGKAGIIAWSGLRQIKSTQREASHNSRASGLSPRNAALFASIVPLPRDARAVCRCATYVSGIRRGTLQV